MLFRSEYSRTTGRPIHFHCDAVQALGKIPFFPEREDIDSASFSAHKFCGPRGVGILYSRSRAVQPLSRGGGQEKGLRPGTENLPGICAMGAQLEETLENRDAVYNRILAFRAKIEAAATESGYTLISPSCNSGLDFSPYIINICAKPAPSEVFLRVMADMGFCLSSGSACSSNSKGKAESVLTAMNIDPASRMSSIRISMGSGTSEDEVNELCNALMLTAKQLGIRP